MIRDYLHYLFAVLGCFLYCFSIAAQEIPPIEIYSTDQYKAENQNWAISQSEDGHIFVANNKGLLEFNGERWKLYPSPLETSTRAVHVVDDFIYTGNYMDFGYWKRDSFGVLNYTSISSQIELPVIDDEQFWNILSLDDFILFQSLNRIVIYNTKDASYKIINSETTLTKIYKVEGTIYYQSINDGIYKIENGKGNLLINDTIIKDKLIVNIFTYDDFLLLQTQNDGFYIYKNGSLSAWNISSDDLLSKVSVYNSIRLKDNSFAIGTISNGIIYLNRKGDLNYHINQSKGLSNNTVLSLFEDKDFNIWLGLDNGINCINTNSPFSIFSDKKGTLGTVYSSIVFNNNLYLGTNQGLFYKTLNTQDDFSFIANTQGQVWSLIELNGTLFCAHNSGTFVIYENKAKLIENTFGTWNLSLIPNHKDLILQGTYGGLNVLIFKNEEWVFRNRIEGFNLSSRYVETFGEDTVFVSHEYKGVFKIQVDSDYFRVLEIDGDLSVEKGTNSSLLKHDGNLLYTFKDGVFKYSKKRQSFERDSLYSGIFKGQTYASGNLVITDKTNKLWSFSNESINYLSSGKLSSKPEIQTIYLPNAVRNSIGGYENISHIEDRKYLLGESSGYRIIDLDKVIKKEYFVSINSIVRYPANKENEIIPIDQTIPGNFKNKENNFQLFFSVSDYNKYTEVEYQYQLKGIYDEWSEWSTESTELFSNLSFGDYTFNVRAKIGNDLSSNIDSYSFSIAKPWYLNNWMIAIYMFTIIIFSLITHNVYKRYYKKQREALLESNKRKIELKQLESEQQLMQLKNESLQQDIDNKNRELAISTMSLIKKNEFLNNIKEALKNVDQNSELKSVIKIIDKNLNNTDDWKFFQEAFNNADKDFLKKIKEKHPRLTPNDLRLCAYLRLNLSSKEIAPLLNISSRSVEVKRYRLRKKMDLPHESSLTNYILEI